MKETQGWVLKQLHLSVVHWSDVLEGAIPKHLFVGWKASLLGGRTHFERIILKEVGKWKMGYDRISNLTFFDK